MCTEYVGGELVLCTQYLGSGFVLRTGYLGGELVLCTDYWGDGMCAKDTCEKKETAEECQQLCQTTEGCEVFSWIVPNANDWVEGRKLALTVNQQGGE